MPAPGVAYGMGWPSTPMVPSTPMAPNGANPPAGTPDAPTKTKISRSVGTIKQLPKCQQVDGIESVEPSLDSTLSGKCDSDELAVLVWLLTRIRPDFRTADLRVEAYEDIFERYKTAATRNKDLPNSGIDRATGPLVPFPTILYICIYIYIYSICITSCPETLVLRTCKIVSILVYMLYTCTIFTK